MLKLNRSENIADMRKKSFFDSIPKIENHLHLEGAIPYATLWELMQKYDDKSVSNVNQLKERFIYRDFNHFIDTWIWKNGFIREYDDFTFLTEAVLTDLAGQNIKYAEIFISPSTFRKTLETQRIIEAVNKGIKKNSRIMVNLIVDLVRNLGPENELKTLFEINEVKGLGIIGIGIGGSEKKFPPELFRKVYEQARKFGFKTTAHAGEAAGSESIWSAIRTLRVDRLGHGTGAVEDPELLRYLAENQIPVELCLISNLRTRVIESIEDHPVKMFINMGIPVSINTDDPKMFGNSLSEEYQTLTDVFSFSEAEVFQMIINSIYTTWLDDMEKKLLVTEFMDEAKDLIAI